MLIVFHKAVQRIGARRFARSCLFSVRYSQTIKETFQSIINISALLKQRTGVFVPQEQDVQGAGQIERISDNWQERTDTLNGDWRTQIYLIPNFDTLTLVGVKKSRNSADFSVSD